MHPASTIVLLLFGPATHNAVVDLTPNIASNDISHVACHVEKFNCYGFKSLC